MRSKDELLRICRARYQLRGMEVQSNLLKLSILFQKYNPNQPRIPLGNPHGGRWSGVDSAFDRDRQKDKIQRIAQGYSMGELVAEIPKSVGRYCIYKFDFGLVRVEGPTNLRCVQIVPSAAVRHGQLLDDN